MAVSANELPFSAGRDFLDPCMKCRMRFWMVSRGNISLRAGFLVAVDFQHAALVFDQFGFGLQQVRPRPAGKRRKRNVRVFVSRCGKPGSEQ